MNILFVTGVFVKENASVSGMPGYIYKATTALKRRGHQVYIVTADDENRSWEYKGLPVYSVKISPQFTNLPWIAFGLYNVLRDYSLQKKISQLVNKLHIDIIQYAGWFGVGLLHSKRMGIPAVMRMSSYAKIQLVASFSKEQINVISKMERWASRNMDGIFAPSHVIADSFADDIKREVKVIETPFEMEIAEESWDYSLYNGKLNQKRYFLFFGRLSPDKGILTIARSLHQLLEEHKDIFFAFAGDLSVIDGENVLDILRNCGGEYKDRIIYLGSLRKEQLYPIIKNACGVLIPSLMDNLPNSCMEAMYLQKIVIGTKGTSLDQLIEDHVNGLLIEPDNDKMLINGVNEVLSMPLEVKHNLGENAFRRIERLRPEITIKELEEYYKNIKGVE